MAVLLRQLTAFMRKAAEEPFAYGEWDCAMFPANWVREVLGSDPAADLRGRYQTTLGYSRILKESGGLVAIFDRLATGAGLVRVREGEAKSGDVAVIMSTVGAVGAVRVGGLWAVKMSRALSLVHDKPLAVWRIGGA